MTEDDPPPVTDQPPSAKLVYTVLRHQGPQTQKELIDETLLAPRTVRYALTDLSDAGVVTESVYFPDARQTLYKLSEDAPHSHRSSDDDDQALQLTSDLSND